MQFPLTEKWRGLYPLITSLNNYSYELNSRAKSSQRAFNIFMKKILVPIANGVEEIESVSIIDILRRAGAEVTVASVTNICKLPHPVAFVLLQINILQNALQKSMI